MGPPAHPGLPAYMKMLETALTMEKDARKLSKGKLTCYRNPLSIDAPQN
jgi:hypothetical protein